MVRQFIHGQRFFQRALRRHLHRGVDPRRVRLPGAASRRSSGSAASSGSSPRRCRGTAPTASPTTRSGGRASTARGCSPTSRRSTRYNALDRAVRAGQGRAPASPTRAAPRGRCMLFGLRRRRRRTEPRHDGAVPAAARPRGPARRSRSSRPRSSSTRPMAEYPDAPRVGRRALLRDAPRHVHSARRGPSRATAACELLLREAELWCVAAYGGRPPTATRPRRSTASGRRCCSTSSTTSSRARRSAGCTARPRRPTPRLIAELEEHHRRRARAAGGGTGRRAGRTPRRTTATRSWCCSTSASTALEASVQPLADGTVALRACGSGAGARTPARADAVEHPVTVESSSTRRRSLDNGLAAGRRSTTTAACTRCVVGARPGARCSPPGGRGGLPQLHHDLPIEYDAWDIEEYYRRRVTDLDEVDVDRGRSTPARSSPGSRVSRLVPLVDARRRPTSCGPAAPRLDVAHRASTGTSATTLLKLAWPLDVHTDDVTRHIQYGHLRTPIHTNTSWDAARFELCAHQLDRRGRARLRGRPAQRRSLRPRRHPHRRDRRRRAHDDDAAHAAEGRASTPTRAPTGRHRVTYSVMPHAGRFRKRGRHRRGVPAEPPGPRPCRRRRPRPSPPLVRVDRTRSWSRRSRRPRTARAT